MGLASEGAGFWTGCSGGETRTFPCTVVPVFWPAAGCWACGDPCGHAMASRVHRSPVQMQTWVGWQDVARMVMVLLLPRRIEHERWHLNAAEIQARQVSSASAEDVIPIRSQPYEALRF